MKLSNNFSLREFTYSSTAETNGIPNNPSYDEIDNMKLLCEKVLQPIRDLWGKPIFITSGYRSPILNRKVDGASNSAHMSGCAVDITVGDRDGNKKLFEMIKFLHQEGDVDFDQLIDEKGYRWIHIGIKPQMKDLRHQILHL